MSKKLMRKIRMLADQAYGFKSDIEGIMKTFENMPDDAADDLDDIAYNVAAFRDDIEQIKREVEDEI